MIYNIYTIKWNFRFEINILNHLTGQQTLEDKNHFIHVSNNNDKILNYCLQLTKKQSKEIILVTTDPKLIKKAQQNGIEAITFKKCMERYEKSWFEIWTLLASRRAMGRSTVPYFRVETFLHHYSIFRVLILV